MAVTSFRAGAAISAGDVVCLVNGLLEKSIGTSLNQAASVGVAIDSGAAGSLIRVNPDSIYTSSLTFVPGDIQYLSVATSGAIVDYPSWQTEFDALAVSGAYLTRVGRAITTSKIEVEIQKPVYIIK
jgi:hypothetical protein